MAPATWTTLAFSLVAAVATGSATRVTRDGVVVDFSLLPSDASRMGALVEGEYADVRFRMTDAASGLPVPGLKPAAWMDVTGAVAGSVGAQRDCKDKVALYLQGTVGIRPMVDLNSYYLLVLNQDASISVIDPVVSMTGSTSLFATIVLKRPAADWIRSADRKRLYLSLPKAGEVAVVDAEGRIVPTADNEIVFAVNDAGLILGQFGPHLRVNLLGR
ncbi:MAG: hypothetical protein WCK73_18665, partial [Deltaproteobacteria bacterium]